MKRLFLMAIAVVLSLMLNGYGVFAEEKQMSAKVDSTRVLFDFQNKTDNEQWITVHDNVMGGLSKGSISLNDDSCMVFSGSISLENNGGFASIRCLPGKFEIDDYTGIKLRLKGDGRDYQFRLRDSRNFDGVAFKHEFQTVADTWIEIELPFDSFLPSFRGRILKNVEPIIPSEIRQMGFLIGDKVSGPFELIVDKIEAYK